MSKNLDKSITDAMTVLAVLLVFAGIFFDLASRRSKELILSSKKYFENKDFLDANKAEAQAVAREIREFLWQRWLWLTALFLVLCHLLTPTALRVVAYSDPALWSFDIVRTLFVLVWITVAVCLLVSVSTMIQLIRRSWRLR